MDHYDPDILTEEAFQKRFHYKNPTDDKWKIPQCAIFSCEGGVVGGLSGVKEGLNEVKSSLNHYEIQKWNKHTTFVNPSGKVLNVLRRRIQPELSTQAWCKFHELLSYGNVIPTNCGAGDTLCSVHLCEAPGGFIASLNHHLKSQRPNVKHKWVGNTLNPYYEGNPLSSCIVDDRLISRTLKSWCFGQDNTGDVFKPEFMDSLSAHCHNEFDDATIGLVTADGSLNCADKPGEQETVVAPLHHVEMLDALQLLCSGGTFVMKMFTLFEVHSASIMYLLCCLFEEVSVIKPATSKAGNSEVYVVCRNYCGLDGWKEFHENLRKHFPFHNVLNKGFSIFPPSFLPDSFIDQHTACVRLFVTLQESAINRNIFYYNNITDDAKSTIKQVQEQVTQRFFDVCNLRKIKQKLCIVPSGVLQSGGIRSNIKQCARLEGSFSDRVLGKGVDHASHSSDNGFESHFHDDPEWIVMRKKHFWWNESSVKLGEKLRVINSSIFCDTDVIAGYQLSFEQRTIDCESAVLRNDLAVFHDNSAEMSDDSTHFSDESTNLSLTNLVLEEDLQRIITQHNHTVLEIEPPCGSSVYSEWISKLIEKTNPTLAREKLNLKETKPNNFSPKKHEVVFTSVVPSDMLKLCWPELNCRPYMLKLLQILMKNIQKRGSCFIILPSYIHSLDDLTRRELQPGYEFVELFSVSQMFSLKSYFFESVRQSNNACLVELSHLFMTSGT
uniref:cap-specific mRNA (nucleoside-2'-O-)-methyltransferase 2-like isoform X2 n=1 Tax=Ciona intestinalis TaxID=7719 RepID=UPI000EF4F16E|nr:cap-specific mRNA (nucleoside-2'-O-)-methyltransferase 2-like isoform X2 [Ciona intestinalis]|eukprot:XP_026691478.1 cap-specific mRNA (nucleoside-2'-O-)-methyltransferase 2-like isoform X2 [Ciona intestinalis]